MSPNLIPLTDALAQLEEAQLDPSLASKTLQTLSLSLQTTHPSLTPPLLDLIQLYPHETIPYLPKLLSASPDSTETALGTLSDLLSADRTLLVPILATLPYLPHSHSQTRATLRYALETVDSDDIPAVIRAIVESPSTPQDAIWAAEVLRPALREPSHDILPVLTEVLNEACRPGHLVGRALLHSVGFPFGWIDAFVLVTALRKRDGPYGIAFGIAMDKLKGIGEGMVGAEMSGICCAFESVVGGEDPGAVRVIVGILAECVRGVEGAVGLSRLVRSLLRACPNGGVGVVEELLRSGGEILGTVLDVLRREGMRVAEECCLPTVRLGVVERDEGWGKLFVSLRKGLLFGEEVDKRIVLELGGEVMRRGGLQVLEEAVDVFDTGGAVELSDLVGVGVLGILGMAVMRGVVRKELAEQLWEKRVEGKCPKGLVRERERDGEELQWSAMQVDIGLIWNQNPSAVSTVVSSVVALRLATAPGSHVDAISVGLLDVLVLVPLICIPLYNAVQDCNRDFDVASKGGSKRSRAGSILQRIGERDVPQTLVNTNIRDLATAISSFGSGMAAIVGILNLSSMSLKLSRKVVSMHGRSRNLKGGDQDVVWTLLERLTEFDRMLNALLLGYELLQVKLSSDKKTGTPSKPNAPRKKKLEAQKSALRQAGIMKEAVVSSMYHLDGSSETCNIGDSDDGGLFPRFSLEAIVCSLIAVPDEAGVEALFDASRCKQTRDIELARIDKMLLRHLFRLLSSCRFKQNPAKPAATQHRPSRQKSSHSGLDRGNIWDLKETEMKIASLANSTDQTGLNLTPNVFFLPEDEAHYAGEEDLDTPFPSNGWAAYGRDCGSNDTEYIRSTISLATKQGDNTLPKDSEVCSIIHSPAFAALLLDRAATYVVVARRGRQSSAEEHVLSTATTVAGFALGSLIAILRIIPMTMTQCSDEPSTDEPMRQTQSHYVRTFLRAMDEGLLVGTPNSLLNRWGGGFATDGLNTILTLNWISQTSIDVSVATLALEALLTISEFGCLRFDFARDSILSSLSTIYEYDSDSLWIQNDYAILFEDSFCQWSHRRRQVGTETSDGARGCDEAPCVVLRWKGVQKFRGIEKHRLNLFFNGMHIPSALLEANGWVREISLALGDSESEASTDPQDSGGISFRVETPSQRASSGPQRRLQKTTKCEALLDMIDFRNIVEIILQLVHHALDHYKITDSFSLDEALDIPTSPISHTQSALKLLCGILRVFLKNRKAVLQEDKTGGTQLDAQLDYLIMSYALSILQVTRGRLDNLNVWYSNPKIDLSQLSDAVIGGLEKTIGCAMMGVKLCTEISDAIKIQHANLTKSMGVDQGSSIAGSRRKNPGFAKGRGRKNGPGEEEISKARRVVPRLSAQCEAVRKVAVGLAKLMGFRKKNGLVTLAPVLPDEDEELGFGISLNIGEEMEIEDPRTEEDMEYVDEVEFDDDLSADRERFQARGHVNRTAPIETRTITVNFQR